MKTGQIFTLLFLLLFISCGDGNGTQTIVDDYSKLEGDWAVSSASYAGAYVEEDWSSAILSITYFGDSTGLYQTINTPKDSVWGSGSWVGHHHSLLERSDGVIANYTVTDSILVTTFSLPWELKSAGCQYDSVTMDSICLLGVVGNRTFIFDKLF